MPTRPPHPCNRPGCPELTSERFCKAHAQAEQRRYDAERGSSAQRGYGSSWRRVRALVLERDPICRLCGQRPSVDVDHIRSKRAGGTDSLDNLRGVCHGCHSVKTARQDGRWGRGGQKSQALAKDRTNAQTRAFAGSDPPLWPAGPGKAA